ncbi:hypothetical protein EHW99_0557 [Erwinia amylovora]|uniref:Uncharacterized protein n=2 Tax=Erwinia amylovora TaxID=552 RepID=A0A831A3S1_ERWAM|nr:hypothetical protein EaACW_3074 [Erwinia amylovora ACW56400]QJQ53264.1 hypothetical protein EHX00_0557 [Erwinia amylovora]CBA22923.1 hypothetical protein predicted by Glimmer/Critica [Erwinia amylovora CFBP1430]CCO79915.1 hypothetical protein BN432_3139 [Erwinia amylovora Ea356]CCO83720.1 hypothetical protein BN433_3165 [Erwinia amylovora Ea266]CCO87481.1 hypothetical protein BN434_3115 [Erwinia amylovora CFBP 2585]CCO91275.1 hypothetical protein BN435_3126 [Erwinia amylovora 01SFR-BO]CCO
MDLPLRSCVIVIIFRLVDGVFPHLGIGPVR